MMRRTVAALRQTARVAAIRRACSTVSSRPDYVAASATTATGTAATGIAAAAAAAAVFAISTGSVAESAAAQPAESNRPGYTAPTFAKASGSSFEAWRETIRETIPASCEGDIEANLKAFVGTRSDKHLMWQTLKEGGRGILKIAQWQQQSEPEEESVGKVRLTTLIELGDALNGHVGVVHGGFSAALLDDLLGQTTIREATARGISGAPLTAGLQLRYKYPVMANGTYLVQTHVESLEPRNAKPGQLPSWNVKLVATIYDGAGHTCVEAKSHYVIKTFK